MSSHNIGYPFSPSQSGYSGMYPQDTSNVYMFKISGPGTGAFLDPIGLVGGTRTGFVAPPMCP